LIVETNFAEVIWHWQCFTSTFDALTEVGFIVVFIAKTTKTLITITKEKLTVVFAVLKVGSDLTPLIEPVLT
jgi:hypothetical protein